MTKSAPIATPSALVPPRPPMERSPALVRPPEIATSMVAGRSAVSCFWASTASVDVPPIATSAPAAMLSDPAWKLTWAGIPPAPLLSTFSLAEALTVTDFTTTELETLHSPRAMTTSSLTPGRIPLDHLFVSAQLAFTVVPPASKVCVTEPYSSGFPETETIASEARTVPTSPRIRAAIASASFLRCMGCSPAVGTGLAALSGSVQKGFSRILHLENRSTNYGRCLSQPDQGAGRLLILVAADVDDVVEDARLAREIQLVSG